MRAGSGAGGVLLAVWLLALVLGSGHAEATGYGTSAVRPLANPDRPARTPAAHRGSRRRAMRATGFCTQVYRHLAHGSSSGGVIVLDAERHRVVCSRKAAVRRPLASNMKVFTTGTALSKFGPDDRLSTRVFAVGNLRKGVLKGNLYLKGAGDPALGSPSFYNRYLGIGTNLFALTAQIRRAGIKQVTGRLYADDSVFDNKRGVADSGYGTSPYIGPLSGLGFNSGYTSGSATSFSSNPAKLAARKLVDSLRKKGVQISSQIALGRLPRSGGLRIAYVRSPMMTRLVNQTNVNSDNYYAEMLMKGIGAKFGGAGTTAAGAAVVERFARSNNASVHAVDGSGLTRTNTSTPSDVARFLESMQDAKVGDAFISDLALAGHEGTVADRMRGTAADGRCRLKTGTLTGVSNLSGYCFNKSGRKMIFSILMDGVGNLYTAHIEQDRIAALVASR